jgi:hypothetical protein
MDSVNPIYRKSKTVMAIRHALAQEGRCPSVALGEFLTPAAFRSLERDATTGWRHVGVPDRGMHDVRKKLPAQTQIRAYARAITGARIVSEPNRRFAHREYTLLHDHETPVPGWRALFFLDDVDPSWGGRVVFVKDGENLGVITPARNTLLIVQQTKGVRMFVEYVNHRARKHRVRILGC